MASCASFGYSSSVGGIAVAWRRTAQPVPGQRLMVEPQLSTAAASRDHGGRSMTDVFISYSRRDFEFVHLIAARLEARGKVSWVDTAGIADAEVFPRAIRTAIEAADAFLFVITPASVASGYCDQEVTYARELEKRIVPVLRIAVPDDDAPEEIRHRNWIPFTEDDDFDASLERVVRALDTDLELRREHTHWLTKSLGWEAKGADRSLLLRGSELREAEDWLARSSQVSDPAPTALQVDYVLASRKANARRSRRVLATSVAVAAVALALGAVALVSRDQAVSNASAARSQVLAAQSQLELTTDPEVSIILAQKAVRMAPTPEAVGALRQALDASRVRVALPTESSRQCGFGSGPATEFSPNGTRVAESLCTGEVVVADAASGRVIYRRHVAAQASSVAYDPHGSVLAVGTENGIDLLDPSTGRIESELSGHGEPNALDFNSDGTLLAATTGLGATMWDLATGTAVWSRSEPDSDHTAAFTPDGRSLVVGTADGYSEVVNISNGAIVRTLVPPDSPFVTTGTPDPVAIEGTTLVVGTDTNGPAVEESGEVDLWDTQNWTMFNTVTTVIQFAISSVAISHNGHYVAVGLNDGTGGVWSSTLPADNELFSLEGEGAQINTLSFNADDTRLVDADNQGNARIYRSGEPWLTTLSQTLASCDGEFGWQPHKLLGLTRTGNALTLQTWALPSFRPTTATPVIPSGAGDECASVSPDGRLVALWNHTNPTSTVSVFDVATRRVELTLPFMVVQTVSFSNDDRLLAVAYGTGQLMVTNVLTHRSVSAGGWPRQCTQNGAGAPVISDDDRLVVTFSPCGLLSVGRIITAKPFETFNVHGQVDAAAFNPVNGQLAIGSLDGSVTVLDVATDTRVQELLGHSREITGVVYGMQGSYIAATSFDNTIRVWDVASGQTLQVDHDFSSTNAPFLSPDGKFLIENNGSGQTNIWPACPDCEDPPALLKASGAGVISPLTPIEQAQVAAAG
jgi:WD40 repeat protein